MSPVTAVSLTNVWGCDLETKLSPSMAAKLANAFIPATITGGTAQPISFFLRYLSLGPQQIHFDLDPAEVEGILATGQSVFAVQHCRESPKEGPPGWETSAERGSTDGAWAGKNAVTAGLVAGMGISVGLDLEDVAQSCWGAQTVAHCTEWCRQVALVGFEPFVYDGFCSGLTPEQIYELPTVRRYAADYGPRTLPTRGFCLKQHSQTTIAGFSVDPQYAFADLLGGCMVAMGPGPVVASPA